MRIESPEFEMLLCALLRPGERLTLGNVNFWLEDDELIHSKPVSAWDKEAIKTDLGNIIKNSPQAESARALIHALSAF